MRIIELRHSSGIKLQSRIARIMVYKGMVYKGKYWISEKNKGIPVSIFGHF